MTGLCGRVCFGAGFWEMYDPEGYSLWFCDYKHNDENQVTFVTMNKVGGFLQRMDFIRKYAFSKMCILGESPPYSIKGVWLFRYGSPSHFANAKYICELLNSSGVVFLELCPHTT
jgi:hypothetical protein